MASSVLVCHEELPEVNALRIRLIMLTINET